MVIPTQIDSIYGTSIIKKQSNQISLHVILVFADNHEKLLSKDFNSYNKGKGTWLENPLDDKFPFANPLITNDALKVFEFLIEVNEFAKRKQ